MQVNLNSNLVKNTVTNEVSKALTAEQGKNVSFQAQQSDKFVADKKETKNVGKFKGFLTNWLAAVAAMPISVALMALMKGESKKLSAQEVSTVINAAETAMEQTGLNKAGAKLINPNASTKALEETAQALFKEMDKKFQVKLYPKQAREMLAAVGAEQFASGKNAGFLFDQNKVIVSDKLSLASFHEIGHAMNRNFSKIGKVLQKHRNTGLFVGMAAFVLSLFTRKKEETVDKKLSAWDKTTNFIRDNVGKIAFLSALPMVVEEGIATVKGNKLAKELLSPELAKKVAKCNAFGGATYVLGALAFGLASYLGIKVKDSVQAKYDAKNA